MKGLKKLVLATAITAATSSAFAMQALDDDTMSNTTGQDGLTITLGTDVTIGALRIHDKDGLTGSSANGVTGTGPNAVDATGFNTYFNGGTLSTYTAAGVASAGAPASSTAGTGTADLTRSGTIYIGGADITIKDASGSAGTVLKIDTGSKANGLDPVLHIGVTAGAQVIGLGGVSVSVRGGDGMQYTSAGVPLANTSADILSFDAGTELRTGGATLNIDLGNQPAGHLIWGTSTLNAGATFSAADPNAWKSGALISLSSLNIVQGANGIGLEKVAIKANGGATSVSTKLTVDVVAGGLQIGTETLGGVGQDISIQNIRLGANYTVLSGGASIGSVYIDNLRTGANTITIAGH